MPEIQLLIPETARDGSPDPRKANLPDGSRFIAMTIPSIHDALAVSDDVPMSDTASAGTPLMQRFVLGGAP